MGGQVLGGGSRVARLGDGEALDDAVHGFALSEADALPILWKATRAASLMTERELRHKL